MFPTPLPSRHVCVGVCVCVCVCDGLQVYLSDLVLTPLSHC